MQDRSDAARPRAGRHLRRRLPLAIVGVAVVELAAATPALAAVPLHAPGIQRSHPVQPLHRLVHHVAELTGLPDLLAVPRHAPARAHAGGDRTRRLGGADRRQGTRRSTTVEAARTTRPARLPASATAEGLPTPPLAAAAAARTVAVAQTRVSAAPVRLGALTGSGPEGLGAVIAATMLAGALASAHLRDGQRRLTAAVTAPGTG